MYLLLCNPTSGGGKGAELKDLVTRELELQDIEYLDVSGSSFESATVNLKNAVADLRVEGLIAIGGDGIVHLSIQILAKTSIPLLLIPAGTGNDFARVLQLDLKDPIANLQKLAKDTINVDLGLVDGKYFAEILSTGFDSIVNERANRFRFNGRWKYNLAMLLELPFFRPREYMFEIDGNSFKTRAMLIAIANGCSYGGGMKVCPDAQIDDGSFDIMILRPVSKFEFLKVFPKVYRGTHVSHPKIEILKGKKVRIIADAVSYADGERIGRLPLNAKIEPGALKVWC